METLFQVAAAHWFSALIFIGTGGYSLFKKKSWGWYLIIASVPMIIIPVIFNAKLEKMFSSPQVFNFNVLDSLMAVFVMGIIQAPVGLIMLISGVYRITKKQDKETGVLFIILGSTLILAFLAFIFRLETTMG